LHYIGGSVAGYLAENGALNETMALRILQQVLSGLKFMHILHIIHGDIKGRMKIFNKTNKLN
jgi:serine/threonine protein kinase